MKPPKRISRLKVLALSALVALPLASCAVIPAPKTYSVGVLNPLGELEGTIRGFKDGMADLGYVEGQNISYIYNGPKSMDQLPVEAQYLADQKVDLFLTITGSATKAAKAATAENGIPVVFVPMFDPVGGGVVESLTHPGGNITGITFVYAEAKRLEWLVKVVPTIQRVFLPYNPNDTSGSASAKVVTEAARELGVEIVTRYVFTDEDVTAALKDLPKGIDAIFVPVDALVTNHLAEIAALKLPTSNASVTNLYKYLLLTAYGSEQYSDGENAARLAAKILGGVKPANLPVELAEMHASLNLKAAKALGLEIPDDIIYQAEIVIR